MCESKYSIAYMVFGMDEVEVDEGLRFLRIFGALLSTWFGNGEAPDTDDDDNEWNEDGNFQESPKRKFRCCKLDFN